MLPRSTSHLRNVKVDESRVFDVDDFTDFKLLERHVENLIEHVVALAKLLGCCERAGETTTPAIVADDLGRINCAFAFGSCMANRVSSLLRVSQCLRLCW